VVAKTIVVAPVSLTSPTVPNSLDTYLPGAPKPPAGGGGTQGDRGNLT
jgi:hypothetical protein